MNEIEHEIEIAKLKADLEKSKSANRYQLISTALGTFLASVIGTYLLFIQNTDKNLQEFDDGHREFISKFIEVALDKDIERRQRLSRYFAFVTLDEKQRSRWEEYAKYLEELIEENPKKIAALERDRETTTGSTERAETESKVRFLNKQLNSSHIKKFYSGNISLADLQIQIRFNEAVSLELTDCLVSVDKNNQPVNICTFEERAMIPNDIILVEANDPKPVGTSTKVLTEVLVINNQFTTVDFYR